MKLKRIIVTLLSFYTCTLYAQEAVIFHGIPSKRIERTADFSRSEIITGIESQSSAVRITKVGDKYFWASRDGIELQHYTDGIYVTYFAVDGSGYIRTLSDTVRNVYQKQSDDTQVGQAMYVEHVIIGLESITFYGR